MKNFLLFIFVLAAACGPDSQENVINLKDYFYPLGEGKENVYVFLEDSTKEYEYEKVMSQYYGEDDGLLDITTYDEKFRETSHEVRELTAEGYKMSDVSVTSYDSLGNSRNRKIEYSQAFFPWKHAMQDSNTYILNATMQIGPVEVKMEQSGYFDLASSSPVKAEVSGSGCIQQMELVKFILSEELDGKKVLVYNVSYYYAKDIGLVYYEAPSTDHIKKYRLQKIISLEEFQRLQPEASNLSY